ncbi:MAG: hypothetical protein WD834_05955, partial [Actinomycetota bacterium]
MRARRWIVVGFVLGACLALPLEAAADGGAFIEFRGGSGSGGGGTHFLPGDVAAGTGYVYVPERWQDLLDRGPFYVFVVTQGFIREGRPLPPGAMRVGTATIEHDSRTSFLIHMSFTVPDLPGDYYNVQICNDPCTISGFREPLTGTMSIVQTSREAQLLNQQQKLWGENWSLERQVRKANKANGELTAGLEQSNRSNIELTAEIGRLEGALDGATNAVPAAGTSSVDKGRPLVDAWALLAIVVALLVALVSV